MKSQQMIYTQVPNTTDGRCTFASLPCGPHKTSHSEIQRGRKKKNVRLQFGHGEIFRREEIIRWVAHVPDNHLSKFHSRRERQPLKTLAKRLGLRHHGAWALEKQMVKKKKLSQSKLLFVGRGLHTRTHMVFQFRWNPFSRVAARSLSLSRASDE